MNGPGDIELRLYVSGDSPRSVRAMEDLRRLCDSEVSRRTGPRYRLAVIDVCRFPAVAKLESIRVTPTVVADGRGGTRRLVGDFSNPSLVLHALAFAGARGRRSRPAAPTTPVARPHLPIDLCIQDGE